jgi:ferredoxin
MSLFFLPAEKLGAWVERLYQDMAVYAPMTVNGIAAFRALGPGEVPDLSRMPASSAKATIFPQTETLFTFNTRKHPEDLSQVDVELTAKYAKVPRVILGARPCDARGFTLMDPVFGGKVKDPYYLARRERTVLATLACERPDRACFCPGAGGGPYDPTGSDLLLHPVSGGWLVEGLTEAGEKLLFPDLFEAAGDREAEAARTRAEAEAYLAKAPDMHGAEKPFWKLFHNEDFWDEATAGCLRCRICAYLCPVCTCFNITDEEFGLSGVRIRTWDHCMSYMFTQEASGHNPRAPKASRMRNRIGHKFCYYPEQHGGVLSCTGCGRCVRSCPAGIDIRRIVASMKEKGE